MKKIFGIALTLILSVCLVCVIAVNASSTPMAATLSEASGLEGSEVTVTLDLANNTTGFGVLSFDVKFDTSKLQLVSRSKTQGILPEGYTDVGVIGRVTEANTNGLLRLTWAPNLGDDFPPVCIYNGTIATLKFKIVDDLAVGTEIPVELLLINSYLEDENITQVPCNVTNGKVTVIACDHAANTNPLTETKTPNCTEEGEKTANCSVCGNLITEPIPVVADAHNYGEWNEVTPGNCTTPAKLERVCSHNAAHKETKDGVTVADNHDWDNWTVTREPNCTDAGEQKRVCKHNASHFETKEVGIEADDHAWGSFTETTPGTCTTPSTETRVCAHNANHKETKTGSINPNNHNYGTWTVTREPNCTDAGEQKRVCSYDANHVETKEVGVEANDHAWGNWTQISAGDCSTAPVEERVCSHNAAHKETRNGTIDTTDHDWGEWTVTREPNCTDAGEQKRVCKNNPNHFETKEVGIEANDHSFGEWTVTREPNCSDAGEQTRVCAHNAAHKETKEVGINATAHKFGEWTETTAATCKQGGEEKRVCAHDANHVETRATAVNPDNHSYGEWTVTTPPTADTEGERTRVCANDASHVETIILEKLGLTYTDANESVAVTPDDNSFIPKNSKVDVINGFEELSDEQIKDFQEYVKEKVGKEAASFYAYGFVDETEFAIKINKASMTIKVPSAEGFENVKYYTIALASGELIDVTDKVVDGVLTQDVEEYGVVYLVATGDKVTPEVPESGETGKNPQNGDNAAIPFVLVATMLAAAAVMVIFKKRANA